MKPKVGDIYLTKFHPGFKSEIEKFRPAVIIATETQHHENRFVTVCPFTTVIKPKDKTIELLIRNPCLEKNSLLLTWYIRTIHTNRLIYRLGYLEDNDLERLKKAQHKLFC